MAVLNICTFPDPILRARALPVTEFNGELQRLVEDMTETMYKAPGIGLAANQVGVSLQVLVVDLQRTDDQTGHLVLVNPEVVCAEGEITYEEGCLSVPEFFATVKRHERLTVRGLDQFGKPLEIQASGLLAVVLQHEMDHLAGKLFIDRIGFVSKDIFMRKWRKRLKEVKE